jgi:hypothetical protein
VRNVAEKTAKMNKIDLEITQKITENQLNEIKIWLKSELDESINDSGFYYNWDIIEKAKNENEVFIIKNETEVIGFLVWTAKEIYVEIDIFEIKPSHRKNGIGAHFFNEVCKYWRKNNYSAVKLFCEPKESEKFWKKMNFIRFPDIRYSIPKLTYYKPLIKVNETTTEIDSQNKLELWNVEPHDVRNNSPKWSWNIDTENFIPILNPCNSNWYIRWTKNGQIVNENKVKRFSKNVEIEFGNFIYIRQLNEQ